MFLPSLSGGGESAGDHAATDTSVDIPEKGGMAVMVDLDWTMEAVMNLMKTAWSTIRAELSTVLMNRIRSIRRLESGMKGRDS